MTRRLAVVCVALALGATACASDTLDADELADARARWDEAGISLYLMRLEGTRHGVPSSLTVAAGGLQVDTRTADLHVETLFARLESALLRGIEADADFADDGHPTRVRIGRELDLEVVDFDVFDREPGCPSDPGTPTDLDAEPTSMLQWPYVRWGDRDGCPVRLDVIADFDGPAHCNWEAVEYLSIGDPLGASTEGGAPSRNYLRDPTGVFARYDDVDRGRTIARADLPGTAADTGFRRGDTELWVDDADDAELWLVTGDIAEVFVLDREQFFMCA